MPPSTPPSTPPSPFSPVTHPHPHAPQTDTLSDIFSASPPPTPTLRPGFTEPSDQPRLRSKHMTEGYRDGIIFSKTRSLQPGVDEGWPLGATFALRVGYLLGVLEGLRGACGRGTDVRSGEKDIKEAGGKERQRQRMGQLLGEARQELAVEGIFGSEWWGEDGVWRYEVKAEEPGGNVTFREVVLQHPVVRRWEGVVRVEVERAGIRAGNFEGKEWEGGSVGAGGREG
ncbi:hypothetical protein N7G274_004118 [Stereocaulon virgatum]|uniref:Protein YAE1 n=1 Tax=Stereocaulon virgatum TaxID=373712 RepID=A0ABR4AC54_9LECA